MPAKTTTPDPTVLLAGAERDETDTRTAVDAAETALAAAVDSRDYKTADELQQQLEPLRNAAIVARARAAELRAGIAQADQARAADTAAITAQQQRES